MRSWIPTQLPVKDLLIVENQNFLVKDTDEEEGVAVALVDVDSVTRTHVSTLPYALNNSKTSASLTARSKLRTNIFIF